ncbi:exodeoxyribonuclease V subunit gamma [Geoalkalibacter halelectricus]|uniref:Exodeoxyribonuclease V subunit gamma n=1 Tax=Geoalkalibacter halelectricus TaxID=2847045 RepID=A0ABY5ZRB7_9BACT|nr:exodeoxyribonuclease V subunit gamma [Geoalkalibacter halelectricus]MDO3376664.1 exodeoxyribonuclease V subunit gamma [Geoalkalibacter halelectricus]UWZ81384.1 exodeoxyribonuclease V subunit gamma [Geoalkalibacter halelectricus]
MSGFHLFLSNRLELLFEELAEVLSTAPAAVLTPEVILVQSRGMQRWLSLRLAERFGAWANDQGSFPFPNAFMRQCFRAVLPGLPDKSRFEPAPLTWSILACLPTLLARPEFAPVRAYLGAAPDPLKSYQFARRLADLFDQYTVYRPDLLRTWDRGLETADQAWQAHLWRELNAAADGPHKAAMLHDFLAAARSSPEAAAHLPHRVAVFGIPAMPPMHLAVLEALALHLDVNLFLLNPSREYWGDIISAREAAKRKKQLSFDDLLDTDLYLGSGHPLLASLGGLGRDFFRLLLDRVEFEEHLCFSDPQDDTLLHCLQSDILLLRHRPDGNAPVLNLDPGDNSVQVHSCHGPLREMEVLQDQLLALFERHPDLMPNDVLVMLPDVEAYAPYIGAVFGAENQGVPRIAFRIADRGLRAQSPVVETFLKLPALVGSRFGVSQVLDILENPAVYRRFGLSLADLDQIRDWIRQTRIRWGIDGADRQRQDLPAYAESTWRAGLERLLLGYALPEDAGLFAEIFPHAVATGDQARVLGCFMDFTTALFDLAAGLAAPRSPQDWARCFEDVLEGFFTGDQGDPAFEDLRQALRQFRETARLAEFDAPLPLEVARAHLSALLEERGTAQGFLAGGVTFCALLPMRSIPFRVIVLSGMNDGAFPRAERPPGFDLMAHNPQPGDRSLRREDRYLFLEALVSARDYFILTYVGQNARDNSTAPPSVLVSELLDCIAAGFLVPEGQVFDHLVRRHHLQAFHPAYFGEDQRLFSYSRANRDALAARLGATHCAAVFSPVALPAPEDEITEVEVQALIRFVRHPQRYFLEERLGMCLPEQEEALEERETLVLEGLERYQLMMALIDEHLSGRADPGAYHRYRARALLPPGTPGEAAFAEADRAARAFVERLRPWRAAAASFLEVDVDLGAARLCGRLVLGGVNGPLRYRYARLKARDRLAAWIAHLAVCAQRGETCHTLLIGSEEICRFAGIAADQAQAWLRDVLELYARGQCRALHFFPESGAAFAAKVRAEQPVESALEAARKVWHGSEQRRGESDDPWLRYSLRGAEPFTEEFCRLTLRIYAPLLSGLEEVRA